MDREAWCAAVHGVTKSRMYAAPLVSRALADSERKMGLHTDTERRAELGSTTGQTPAMAHCAPRGLAYLSLLETCLG